MAEYLPRFQRIIVKYVIFIFPIVLTSARSDSVLFCELVSSGPPVLTYFY